MSPRRHCAPRGPPGPARPRRRPRGDSPHDLNPTPPLCFDTSRVPIMNGSPFLFIYSHAPRVCARAARAGRPARAIPLTLPRVADKGVKAMHTLSPPFTKSYFVKHDYSSLILQVGGGALRGLGRRLKPRISFILDLS
ncbi:hypothetical protein EVAR_86763_1 [Eumeta japonica]|uniref:Uncharacterized protein n=1 Tax=Eumeta variegata TaxID=151549 RepID=A0A4C1W226_EUMVA|nr:hypothetical protein EVAR_86763_1 [Eumeta japonica]